MKILFVDDDAMNRRVVKDMLDVIGASMDEAESGEAGLRKVDGGNYNVILMDLRMPGMDGLEATRAIRRRPDAKAAVPIVVITADTSSDLRDRCAHAGADEVLMKPVAMASLMQTIGGLLARSGGQGAILS